MLKLSRLPLGVTALIVASPVLALAASPVTSSAPQPAAPVTAPAKPGAMRAVDAPKTATVDVNSATAADLKALPGVTDAEAAKIVQGRPYKDPGDLVTKKILSDAEFAKIKDRLTAGHPKS